MRPEHDGYSRVMTKRDPDTKRQPLSIARSASARPKNDGSSLAVKRGETAPRNATTIAPTSTRPCMNARYASESASR